MEWAEFDVGGSSLGIERIGEDDKEPNELCDRFLGGSLQVEDIRGLYEKLTKQE